MDVPNAEGLAVKLQLFVDEPTGGVGAREALGPVGVLGAFPGQSVVVELQAEPRDRVGQQLAGVLLRQHRDHVLGEPDDSVVLDLRRAFRSGIAGLVEEPLAEQLRHCGLEELVDALDGLEVRRLSSSPGGAAVSSSTGAAYF